MLRINLHTIKTYRLNILGEAMFNINITNRFLYGQVGEMPKLQLPMPFSPVRSAMEGHRSKTSLMKSPINSHIYQALYAVQIWGLRNESPDFYFGAFLCLIFEF